MQDASYVIRLVSPLPSTSPSKPLHPLVPHYLQGSGPTIKGLWQCAQQLKGGGPVCQVNGVVLESAATIVASYGPLKASDCVLLGSKIDALPVGVAHELFIQPAQFGVGAAAASRPCPKNRYPSTI